MIRDLSNGGVRIATIDNFQGEENKIIIVSLVRSNPRKIPGFLKVENRVNVLLSRAKHGLYLIGNRETVRFSIDTCMQLVHMCG
jgi:superfamily I DNA and/or RNA helicase